MTQPARSSTPSFADQANLAPRSFAREVWDFLRFNKKWWLMPIVIVMLLLGAIIMIGGTAAAPFIYTLF
jgi:uncharacterized protein DUF5989